MTLRLGIVLHDDACPFCLSSIEGKDRSPWRFLIGGEGALPLMMYHNDARCPCCRAKWIEERLDDGVFNITGIYVVNKGRYGLYKKGTWFDIDTKIADMTVRDFVGRDE